MGGKVLPERGKGGKFCLRDGKKKMRREPLLGGRKGEKLCVEGKERTTHGGSVCRESEGRKQARGKVKDGGA